MPQPSEAWVWLAQIRRPQGRKGEVLAEILTDFPDKFAERRKLWLIPADTPSSEPGSSPREVELRGHWLHKGGVVLHFAGVESITGAEALKGWVVAVPRAERVPLDFGEAYVSDLIDCELVDVGGGMPLSVGVIDDVERNAGPAPLLVVRGARSDVLVPFAKSYLHKIDLEAKRVEMALPEGLVDLNSSRKD